METQTSNSPRKLDSSMFSKIDPEVSFSDARHPVRHHPLQHFDAVRFQVYTDSEIFFFKVFDVKVLLAYEVCRRSWKYCHNIDLQRVQRECVSTQGTSRDDYALAKVHAYFVFVWIYEIMVDSCLITNVF